MIALALEIFVLATLAFGGGVLAGRMAYAVSSRAAGDPDKAVLITPEMDPDTDIEEIYALFEPEDGQNSGEPEEADPSPPVSSQIGQIPDPAPPAQVKFDRLLKEARERKQKRSETNS